MDLHEEPPERHPRRLIPRKRSPLGSPKRLRSPPPAKRISLHRSPPKHHHLHTQPNGNKVRARSPAPTVYRSRARLSSSVPRRHNQTPAVRFKDFVSAQASANVTDEENDGCMTPRIVNRGAIDIVMGLEMKKQRRREKLYEKHCKLKAQREKQHEHHHKHGVPSGVLPKKTGKGAEKMREMVTGGKVRKGSTVFIAPPIVFGPQSDEIDDLEKNATPIAGNGGLKVPSVGPVDQDGLGPTDVHMMSY